MSVCKYLKQKLNKQLECKKNKRLITLADCSSCNFKTFELNKKSNINFKTNFKLIEKQNKRFSIIYRNLSICAECKSKNDVAKNEVYEGAKRGVSMTNGFVVPLCRSCHNRFHNDRAFALKFKKMFQAEYEKYHTREEFLNLIHHNYL